MIPLYKKLILVFLVCSLFPLTHSGAAPLAPSQPAQAASSLPADDIINVYEMAIKNDPQFRGADNDQKALRESLSQAYARLMPLIKGEVVYGRVIQKIKESANTVFGMGESDYDSETYTLKLIQPIFRLPLLFEVTQAENLEKRADVDLEFAKQELIIRVAQAYFTALASKESLAFANAEKADIEVLHDRASVKHQSGIAPVTDLYDARARLASANAQVIKAESDYRDALLALQEMCDKGFMDLKNLRENLPMEMPDPDDAGHWVKVGLDRNLKLKIQQFDSEVARIEVDRQRSGHFPTFDVVGRYNRQDTGGSLFGGGSVVDTQDIMLEVNVPIFEGGLILSKTKEAKAKSLSAAENMERQRRAVVRQVNSTYDGIKTAKSRSEALEKSIEFQSNVLAAKKQGYQSGIFTSLAVMDASRDLYLLRRDYAQSRYDYVFNTLRLKQAIGTLSDADLIIVNNWLR
ncbi:MAG: TolC family outer membrane protein [Planctomycetales bacterium]|nr:TolC family outer membrane protein [Planctomycetales bacterium]